jgi:putative transposase
MYAWRQMTDDERREVLDARKAKHHPWHSPPHRFLDGERQYIINAACYEHASIVGKTAERMNEFSDRLIETCGDLSTRLFAWCVLPNHYHLVVQTTVIKPLLGALGMLHGRTSHQWNGEEQQRGRRVWSGVVEREMRSERHLWASINYVHHNPVRHGHAISWQDWPWGSACGFLDEVGRERAIEIWQQYPIKDYGEGWD